MQGCFEYQLLWHPNEPNESSTHMHMMDTTYLKGTIDFLFLHVGTCQVHKRLKTVDTLSCRAHFKSTLLRRSTSTPSTCDKVRFQSSHATHTIEQVGKTLKCHVNSALQKVALVFVAYSIGFWWKEFKRVTDMTLLFSLLQLVCYLHGVAVYKTMEKESGDDALFARSDLWI